MPSWIPACSSDNRHCHCSAVLTILLVTQCVEVVFSCFCKLCFNTADSSTLSSSALCQSPASSDYLRLARPMFLRTSPAQATFGFACAADDAKPELPSVKTLLQIYASGEVPYIHVCETHRFHKRKTSRPLQKDEVSWC